MSVHSLLKTLQKENCFLTYGNFQLVCDEYQFNFHPLKNWLTLPPAIYYISIKISASFDSFTASAAIDADLQDAQAVDRHKIMLLLGPSVARDQRKQNNQ